MTIDISIDSASQAWWRQACVYQIYPRSFADANGDGIGDFRGIIERVLYFKDLGVDAVWLSPFYPSPLNDGGYDVSDYRNVDSRIGTLDDFVEMTNAFRDLGIKVIVDIVPNHSSSDHPWFKEALTAAPGSPERDRYLFVKGQGPHGELPPSDWKSIFGGPAWSPSGANDGEWYLHLYDKTQPDFNWKNDEVRRDFEKTIRFWGDLGVSGFRVDVATGCAKDLSAAALARPWSELAATRVAKSSPAGLQLDHPVFDRDEVLEIYQSWRRIMNEYSPPLTAVAEAFVSPRRKQAYASPKGLGQVFSFDLLFSSFEADQYREVIDRQLRMSKENNLSSTWVLSTHDVVRHASRFGLPPVRADNLSSFLQSYRPWLSSDGREPACSTALGLRKARAATLMMLALPGSSYLYQGEELGLPEVADLPEDVLQDPSFYRTGRADKGRDGCRVPLPWATKEPHFGFGSGLPPHLPQPPIFAEYAVDAQQVDPGSTLSMYRRALALRRALQCGESLSWLDLGSPDVMAFQRPNGWTAVLNTGSTPVDLPGGKVLISSLPFKGHQLPPDAAVWLQS